jgi:tetratricopeptide (TPR) repeat protein
MVGLRKALAVLGLMAIGAVPAAAGWDEAMAAYREGRYGEAVEGFAAGAEMQPEDARWHYMLGLALVGAGRPGRAVGSLERALEIEPGVRHALPLAQAQIKAGVPGEALGTLDRYRPGAEAGEEEAVDRWAGLVAVAAGTVEDAGAAVPLLAAAIERRPGSRDLRLALGRAHAREGDHGAAFEAYAAAFEIGNGGAVDAAGALAIRSAFDAAEAGAEGRHEWYRRAADVAGRLPVEGAPVAHLLLAGDALLLADRPAAAEERFAAVAALEAGNPVARYQIARCRLALDDPEAALEHLEQAEARDPDPDLRRRVFTTRAEALADLERYEAAADAYRRAGDGTRAAQMDEAAAAKIHNDEVERERERCRQEWARIAGLRDRNRDVEGTAVWAEIDRQAAHLEAECGPPPEQNATR